MTLALVHPTLSSRQTEILNRINETGFITIESLAKELNVSGQTIRRDIIVLANGGLLQRFHGGAGPASIEAAARLDYGMKRTVGAAEKRAVGLKAAAAVPDGARIFLDVGTTVEACAVELAKRPGFQIFTNSMRTAMLFDPADHGIHVPGGRVAGRDGSLIGEEVIDWLHGLNLDIALLACSAVDADKRVMDFDLSKIAIKKVAMRVSKQSYLLATRSKFGRSALATICPLNSFDDVFSD